MNFTNSIVGAGCIGLGSAMARSGGLISIVTIATFAILTKLSFDLVILLSVETEGARGSYEQLGFMTFGNPGRIAVVLSKFLYSFGCLVAYVKIVKDNFSSAMQDLTDVEWNQDLVTLTLSSVILLPLCLVRDITLLERVSIVKLMVVVSILSIIIYLYVANPGGAIRHVGASTYTQWFEVRSGYIESLGTFVFTFVAQHTEISPMNRFALNIGQWRVGNMCPPTRSFFRPPCRWEWVQWYILRSGNTRLVPFLNSTLL